MEIKDIEKLKNKIYSPKQVLAHFVVASKDILGDTGERLVVGLIQCFIKNANNKMILESLSRTSLRKITNYWELSIGQAIAYGYVVFSNLQFENENFTEEKITDKFVYEMQFYSPDNITDFVIRQFREKNINIDRWLNNSQ